MGGGTGTGWRDKLVKREVIKRILWTEGYTIDSSGKVQRGNTYTIAESYENSTPQVVIKLHDKGLEQMKLKDIKNAVILESILRRNGITCEFETRKGIEEGLEDIQLIADLLKDYLEEKSQN